MPTPRAQALDDPGRLDALAETRLMDSPAEDDFDRVTRLACRVLGVPVSLVSMVDDHRQFFKSAVGLDEPFASRRQTPLSHSFCQHVVATGAPLVVEDARTDPQLMGSPAIDDLGVVAYLGVPLLGPDGDTLGSLCAIDHDRREWGSADVEVLRDLASGLSTEFALRVHAFRLDSFTRTAAHELRTPLTSMRVRLEDVTTWPDLPEPVREELVAVLGQVLRLSDSVEQQLAVAGESRFGAHREAPLDDILRRAADRWVDSLRQQRRSLVVGLETLHASTSAPASEVLDVLDAMVAYVSKRGHGPITLEGGVERGTPRIRVADAGEDPGSDAARDAVQEVSPDVVHDAVSDVVQDAGSRAGHGGSPAGTQPSAHHHVAADSGDLLHLAEASARAFGGRIDVALTGGTSLELLLPRGH